MPCHEQSSDHVDCIQYMVTLEVLDNWQHDSRTANYHEIPLEY